METTGVLLRCPMYAYLEKELDNRFKLYRFWNFPQRKEFLSENGNSIRAVVGNASLGADAELIDALPNLEIVSSFSGGLDKIDLAKCREKGIRVTNTPDVLTGDIADLAIGLMLAVLRRICECDRHVRKGLWKMGSFELGLTTKFSGRTIGIIGLGRIGSAIAKRAEETRHIVNREAIDALGPEGVLINIGRGPHVDERVMVSALVEGRLAGAGLDVFENEPCVPEELFALDNVVLLPHVGSDTVETCKAMADLVISNLEAHFLNEPLLTPVKKEFLSENGNSIRAVVGNAFIGADAELIDTPPNLEIVSSFSVGLDKIDLAKCKEKGILVTNTPDVLTDDVADLAIGLMLSVLRKICVGDRHVRKGLWKMSSYKLTTKFSGKTIGIIGLGRIGSAIAKRAEGFDCQICYHSRTEKQNTSYKGSHVDEREMVLALVEGRLGGAGLDVFENEPNVPEELFGLDNVVLLPHVGSGTVETRKVMADLVLGNLEAHFLNKPLLTPVV
ncbi:unnamed protein product [Cuscuta campestris]|uniref:Glyoxylate reductase n=1 Tax=Cuscuta campestris TaxID=132261 RepID=A0A484MVG9_9ASTE|nr:unnamed protein product [Cuscuta campestris]